MSKQWDNLRRVPQPESRPIMAGTWKTSSVGPVEVTVCDIKPKSPNSFGAATLTIRQNSRSSGEAQFLIVELRELAEFCTELADQLEGK